MNKTVIFALLFPIGAFAAENVDVMVPIPAQPLVQTPVIETTGIPGNLIVRFSSWKPSAIDFKNYGTAPTTLKTAGWPQTSVSGAFSLDSHRFFLTLGLGYLQMRRTAMGSLASGTQQELRQSVSVLNGEAGLEFRPELLHGRGGFVHFNAALAPSFGVAGSSEISGFQVVFGCPLQLSAGSVIGLGFLGEGVGLDLTLTQTLLSDDSLSLNGLSFSGGLRLVL